MEELKEIESLVVKDRISRKTSKKSLVVTGSVGSSAAGYYVLGGIKLGGYLGSHGGIIGAGVGVVVGASVGIAAYGISEITHNKRDRDIDSKIKTVKKRIDGVDAVYAKLEDSEKYRRREVSLLVLKKITKSFKKGLKILKKTDDGFSNVKYKDFLCHITNEVPEDPIIGTDGLLYDRFMLAEYATISSTYPVGDSIPLTGVSFIPTDVTIKAIIKLAINVCGETQLLSVYTSLFSINPVRKVAEKEGREEPKAEEVGSSYSYSSEGYSSGFDI